jgi:hypothetical protein
MYFLHDNVVPRTLHPNFHNWYDNNDIHQMLYGLGEPEWFQVLERIIRKKGLCKIS